jgi:hypothetical protein
MNHFLESELQAALLLAAPAAIPDLRLFRRNVSVVRINDRRIKHGIKGQADLYGYWKCGIAIELELKALDSSTRKGQKEWAAFCQEWGVTYLLLKPLKDETLKTTVDRWCQEIRASRRVV